MSWEIKAGKLVKEFKFDNFVEAVAFVNKILPLAEKEGHHPDILIHSYNKVEISVYTHSSNGIGDKDFSLSKKIDLIGF